MNGFTESVIAGVISNGLTAILGQIAQRGRNQPSRRESLQNTFDNDPALATIFQRATASAVRSTIVGGEATNDLKAFLCSPEVDAIVRQIYSSQLTKERDSHFEPIQSLFVTALSLRLGRRTNEVHDLGQELFDTLHQGCERALAIAIDNGVLAAHEAKSASRHRLIRDELAGIKKTLALLSAPQKPDVNEILTFEERYRSQVASRHAYITPPNFDVARKLPIDQIYVSPAFVATPKKKNQHPERLSMEEFLGVIYRAVLLGNPGGGKSTFAVKLCHELAIRYQNRLVAGRQLTPILVVLRDFGAEKKFRSCSILQFIESTSNSNYQTKPPQGGFEYLVLNGRAMVIFDGLDELLETRYRQEITSDVETFCSLYPSVPVLVTSREVGYEQAPLDENRFETFRLSPFDEEQVRTYSDKWFSGDLDLSMEQRKQKSEAFLRESGIVPDLRSNPLMLALMCNIYRGENYIPRNRPDVYEKCALMLFERWDKNRGIHVMLPFEAHIRPTMMYLAYWIYSDESLQGGVTEQKLIAKATDYLCPKRFEDTDEAEKAATEFIAFCRGRAWVFTDTGTTKDGENLYQFTHRTFLEYFTAAHIVRTHPTPDSLGSILLPRIAKREWDVVAQLAFQIQNKNVEGAADMLLSRLITEAQSARGNRGLNLLSFAARSVEFLVPSPKTTRDAALITVKSCFERVLSHMIDAKPVQRRPRGRERAEPVGSLGNLLCAANENRGLIADTLARFFIERINSNKDIQSLAAMDISLPIPFAMCIQQGERAVDSTVTVYWQEFSEKLLNDGWKRVEQLYLHHPQLMFDLFFIGKVSLSDVVKLHGVEVLFTEREYASVPTVLPSVAELLLFGVEDALPFWISRLTSSNEYLRDMGQILLDTPLPWISRRQVRSEDDYFWFIRNLRYRISPFDSKQTPGLGSDELFGAFCLIATMLEANEDDKDLPDWIKAAQHPCVKTLRDTLLGRIRPQNSGQMSFDVQLFDFDQQQKDIVQQWVRRKINFMEPAGKSAS